MSDQEIHSVSAEEVAGEEVIPVGTEGTSPMPEPVQEETVVTPTPTAQTPKAEDTSGQPIGEDQARQIALSDAGVSEAELSGIHILLEADDGVQVYEVEFYVGTAEYDYEIDAISGEIRSCDNEVENIFPHTVVDHGSNTTFSEEDAIALVLSKVPGAAEDQVHIHLERDDGVLIYEGHVIYNGDEYEFELHAETGAVLEWEVDDD